MAKRKIKDVAKAIRLMNQKYLEVLRDVSYERYQKMRDDSCKFDFLMLLLLCRWGKHPVVLVWMTPDEEDGRRLLYADGVEKIPVKFTRHYSLDNVILEG